MITILMSAVPLLSPDDGRESGEGLEYKLYIVCDFIWYSVVYILLLILLCYTVVSVYYWVPYLYWYR